MLPNKVNHRPDLGQVVSETAANAPELGYIADIVMPYFSVPKQAGMYPVLPAHALFNVADTGRASGGNYNRSTESFEAGFFATFEQGLEMPIDDRFKAMYRTLFDMEAATSNILMGKIQRAREMRVAAKVMNASNYPTMNVSTKWSVSADADPKSDIDAAKEAMRKKGVPPNKLIIAWGTYLNLKKVTKVQDAVKYLFPDTAKTGTIGIKHLEAYLEIEIEVGGALKNSAKKGVDKSLADIWSDSYAMLARVAAPGADITDPSIGRTIIWNEGSDADFIVEDYYSEEVRSKILRVRHDSDETLLTSINPDTKAALSKVSYNCGLLIGNIS